MLHAIYIMTVFYRTRVIADRSFTLREEGFSTFLAPMTSTLTPWPSYTNLIMSLRDIYMYMKPNFMWQGLGKLSSDTQTDRQTYIHTYKSPPKLYVYHAASRVVNQWCDEVCFSPVERSWGNFEPSPNPGYVTSLCRDADIVNVRLTLHHKHNFDYASVAKLIHLINRRNKWFNENELFDRT